MGAGAYGDAYAGGSVASDNSVAGTKRAAERNSAACSWDDSDALDVLSARLSADGECENSDDRFGGRMMVSNTKEVSNPSPVPQKLSRS